MFIGHSHTCRPEKEEQIRNRSKQPRAWKVRMFKLKSLSVTGLFSGVQGNEKKNQVQFLSGCSCLLSGPFNSGSWGKCNLYQTSLQTLICSAGFWRDGMYFVACVVRTIGRHSQCMLWASLMVFFHALAWWESCTGGLPCIHPITWKCEIMWIPMRENSTPWKLWVGNWSVFCPRAWAVFSEQWLGLYGQWIERVPSSGHGRAGPEQTGKTRRSETTFP